MRAITLKEVTKSDFYFKKSYIGIFQHHESEGSYHAYHICNCQSTFRTLYFELLSSTHIQQRVCRFSIAVDSHGERKKREFEKQKSHTWYLYILLMSRIFHTSSHFTLHIAFSLLSGNEGERENEWMNEWRSAKNVHEIFILLCMCNSQLNSLFWVMACQSIFIA